MKIPTKLAASLLGLAAAALLAACGSGSTRTVTVTRTVAAATSAASTTTGSSSTTPAPATSTSTSTATTSAGPPATSTTSTSTTTTTTPPTSTTTTRTETGPAFVGNPSASGALGAALALLTRKGYTALDVATYRAGDTLRVLIGRAAGGERAFFFDQSTYLGTDSSAASAQLSVHSQSDTEVVLRYSLYAPGATSPSGSRLVRFALDMGQLSPTSPIPGVSVRR